MSNQKKQKHFKRRKDEKVDWSKLFHEYPYPYTHIVETIEGRGTFDSETDYYWKEVVEVTMTHNQIDYLNYIESRRTHQANEAIGRANVAVAQNSLDLEKKKWATTKKNVKADTKKKKAETKNVKADTRKKKAEVKGIKATTSRTKAETKRTKAETKRAKAETDRARAEAAAIPKQLAIAAKQAETAAKQAAAAYKNASTNEFNAKVNAAAQGYANALKKADAKVRKAEYKRLQKTLPSVIKEMKAKAKSADLKAWLADFEHKLQYDKNRAIDARAIETATKAITFNAWQESDKDLSNYWLNKIIGGAGVGNIIKTAGSVAVKKGK